MVLRTEPVWSKSGHFWIEKEHESREFAFAFALQRGPLLDQILAKHGRQKSPEDWRKKSHGCQDLVGSKGMSQIINKLIFNENLNKFLSNSLKYSRNSLCMFFLKLCISSCSMLSTFLISKTFRRILSILALILNLFFLWCFELLKVFSTIVRPSFLIWWSQFMTNTSFPSAKSIKIKFRLRDCYVDIKSCFVLFDHWFSNNFNRIPISCGKLSLLIIKIQELWQG